MSELRLTYAQAEQIAPKIHARIANMGDAPWPEDDPIWADIVQFVLAEVRNVLTQD